MTWFTGIQAGLTVLLLLAGAFWNARALGWLGLTSLASLFLQWCTVGQAEMLLWGSQSWWSRHAVFPFIGASIVFSTAYVSSFLSGSLSTRGVRGVCRLFQGIGCVSAVLPLLWESRIAGVASSVVLMVLPFFLASLGILACLRGQRTDGLRYLVAHSLGSIGLPFHILALLGVLDFEAYALDCIAAIGTIQGISLHAALVGRRVQSALAERRRAEEIELLIKKAQLSPHFFANALNGVSALLHTRPEEADELLSNLANLQRELNELVEERRITLTRELAFVARYVSIEGRRFGTRFVFECKVASSLAGRGFLVPPLCVQTLVENAIKHGVAPRARPTVVSLEIEESMAMLRIVCRNEMPEGGREPGALEGTGASRGGTGLANLARRVSLTAGPGATVSTSIALSGFKAELVIPLST